MISNLGTCLSTCHPKWELNHDGSLGDHRQGIIDLATQRGVLYLTTSSAKLIKHEQAAPERHPLPCTKVYG
jgi:hypothetical protein